MASTVSSASRVLSRHCSCNLRLSSSSLRSVSRATSSIQSRHAIQRRFEGTAAAPAPNAKISTIVDQISQLTLLETADLVSTLKERLNIPDMPMGGFAAAGPGGAGGAGAAPAAVEEDEPAPKAEEKTLFNLKLQSFDAAAKPKIIKEVKQLLGLSLVDSKKFVESAPKLMKESVPKEDCEKIIETMKGLGAVVVME